jgi:hypothetical protein
VTHSLSPLQFINMCKVKRGIIIGFEDEAMAARMSRMRYQAPQACRSMCSRDLCITLRNQGGKPDAAFADIPSGVNVLEENVTENPEFCVIS